MKKVLTFLFLFFMQVGISQTLTVMTYNIRYDNPNDGPNRWENRKEHLISQLNFYAPDVFGTQEGLLHQLQAIENGLDDYTFFGVSRDDGGDKGEFTAIFYRKNSLELLNEGTFWLSLTPEKPSKAWDAALPRICTFGLFEIKQSRQKFLVFNAHFDHVGEQARRESAALILSRINQLNPDKLPVVLMGDLNMQSDAPGIQLILESMQDTHISAGQNAHGPEGTFNGFDVSKPVDRRIDYIFVSSRFKVLKSGILGEVFNVRYPSDHFPVYAKLIFNHQ